MRAYNTAFNQKNSALRKELRWIIALSFDTANTDIHYFTSHADCEIPSGTASSDVTYSVLKNPIVNSQKLDTRTVKFSIGSMSFELVDKDSAITNLLNTKLAGGDGVRHKRVRIYKGYAGLAWADYVIPPGGTQIVDDKQSSNKGTYIFRCKDIQRTAQKNVFDTKKTNLTAAYTAGDGTVTVADTSEFEMVAHGTSFTDAPSSTVGYFKIGDNVIRYTGKTSTTFTGCVGGRFNTKDVNVAIDSGATNDRQPEVEEFIYLEMPGPKMAKTILMGTNPTVPDHWHLGISSDYVATSQFNDIGIDLFDTTDDTAGFVLRFMGLKKRDGKKFIQEQINLPMGCFMPVLADGQLGCKRMTGIVSGAAPVAVLDESNTISYSSLDHDQAAVSNQYILNWNTVVGKDKLTRRNVYIDSTSTALHQITKPYELNFEGLHGSRHSDAIIRETFNVLRDRYSGPPMHLTVKLFQTLNGIELGDIVWCDYNQRDFVNGSDLQRAFEVVGVNDNGKNITLNLFGSSQKAGALVSTSAATVLADSFYSSGLTAGNKLDSATTGSLTGSVWHITGDSTLTGGADMTATSAIFWYDGDVTIDSGVLLKFEGNVQLRVMGTITDNGDMDFRGAGIAGITAAETVGTAGYLGNTQAQGGFRFANKAVVQTQAEIANGTNSTPPLLNLSYNGTTLAGIPTDMRGTSGGAGMDAKRFHSPYTVYAAGGAGGDGGSAGLIICRGVVRGGSGRVLAGGVQGSQGTDGVYSGYPTETAISGAGASGFPGAIHFIMDGNTSNVLTESDITVDFPAVNTHGRPLPRAGDIGYRIIDKQNLSPFCSPHFGLGGQAVNCLQVQYVPPNETPAEDVEDLTDPPTAISIAEAAATNNSMNLVALEISVTAPAATNYRGSMIYIKKNGTNSWQQVGEARAAEEVIFYVPADGTQYNVKAHPISIKGIESDEFYGPTNHTVATTQVAVVGTNNSLVTSATTGEGSNGEGVEISAGGIKGYDTGGIAKVIIDAATGIITATSAVISGAITATSGVIGGWTIGANSISKGNVTLDAANTRFQAGPNASDYVRIDTNGITGVDSVLGTTFSIPTDGSAPTFASGVINSTTFNITSSGILETSSTAGDGTASGAGVRINNTGIKGWEASNATPNFHLDATDGKITAIDGAFSGTITASSFVTSASGQRVEVNPSSDNEIHFYGDRGDSTVEELATIGISTLGSDSVIGYFGSLNSSNVSVAAINNASATMALYAINYGSGNAAQIDSISGTALVVNGAAATDKIGINSFGGAYGGYFRCGYSSTGYKRGPIRIGLDNASAAPTPSAPAGTLWGSSGSQLYENTDSSTTWNMFLTANSVTPDYSSQYIASEASWTPATLGLYQYAGENIGLQLKTGSSTWNPGYNPTNSTGESNPGGGLVYLDGNSKVRFYNNDSSGGNIVYYQVLL